ncbi:MAG: HAD hydrolase-like protein [Arcobacteraceae bacterium]|jgi:phosphoglycolate phosphatase-like HAD superfamily hydrolase|nr:HAD hydrolase-like protein [Arcobacteraceae bacterium]MDY0364636.1 HAD hydrolase-like protein [Arcobacteraceae bacterium]
MINFSKYDNIIFDFDGVIIDSNFIKEKCISQASKNYAQKDYHNNFIEYFTKNNGIPRELKIAKFFSKDEAKQIQIDYENCLFQYLNNLELTAGLVDFLYLLKFHNIKPYILSGAPTNEIYSILKIKKIDTYFVEIFGGPRTKEANLQKFAKIEKTLFIGDSQIDYEVADKFKFDFIFMYGYTQFDTWKEFFKDKKILMSIKDFSTLTNYNC